MSKNIKIEVLYGEFANLFGELQNINYIKDCVPEAEIINTKLHDVPAFVSEDVDMVYMGAMTENQQELVIEALKPYRDKINELIDKETVFLFTGNALEIVEKYIVAEDGRKIEALGIFDTYAKRDMMHRFNSLILGEFEGIKLVSFKAQFSKSYGDNSNDYFFDVIRGEGLGPDTMKEGLRRNNFFATYSVGPFLVLNPLFVKYLLKLMGVEDVRLAFEPTIMAAYEQRLKEFSDEKCRYQ